MHHPKDISLPDSVTMGISTSLACNCTKVRPSPRLSTTTTRAYSLSSVVDLSSGTSEQTSTPGGNETDYETSALNGARTLQQSTYSFDQEERIGRW